MSELLELESNVGKGALYFEGVQILTWDDHSDDGLSAAHAWAITQNIHEAMKGRLGVCELVTRDVSHLVSDEADDPDWDAICQNIDRQNHATQD